MPVNEGEVAVFAALKRCEVRMLFSFVPSIRDCLQISA
jgi:hypothetical protein